MQAKGMQGESAKQVAIDVLRKARGPLRASEVAKRVIESGRCVGLKGKTPEATISAMLAVGSKPGGPFKRVDKGTYTLSEQVAKPKPAAKPQKRNAVSRPKRTSKKGPAADAAGV
jgi:hypothetical protein